VEYLKKYKEKSEETPEYNYILSLLKEKKAMSLYEYEEAYILLKESFKGFVYYPEDVKKDFCKSFEFCETTCINRIAALETILYERYRLSKKIEKMNEFILKFPDCHYFNDAVDYRDSLAYEQVEKTNTIESYKNFIDAYPNSKLVYNAKDNVHAMAFDIAKTTNTIEAYQQFIKDYPNSFQAEKATQKITDIEYQNAVLINSIEGYKSFLKKYPNSSYNNEIKIFVEDLEWKDADKTGSISAYQNFISNYPNSIKRKEAENKIDDLKKIALPYLLSNRKYKFYYIDKNIFVSDEEFDEVTYLVNGDFFVKKNKLCGIVNRKGIKIIPCKYECINASGNYYIIGMQHKFGLVNRNGESIIELKEDGLQDGKFGFLISGKKRSTEDEYFSGVMNLKGEQILENVYDIISIVDSNHIIGMKSEFYYLYNGYGQLLTSGYSTIIPANNCFIYSKDDAYGLLGLDGKVKTATSYSYINSIDSNYFSATNSAKKTGVININGEEIIPFGDYDAISAVTKNVIGLTKYGTDDTYEVKTKLYNIKDKSFINSSSYNSVYAFGNNSIYTQKDNNFQILDENGSLLFGFTNEPTENEDAYGDEGFGEGGEGFHEGGDEEYNYFDCSGYIESNSGYIEMVEYNDGIFNCGLASINVNGKYGYLNKTYEIALPLKYNIASSFKHGVAQVSVLTKNENYTYNIIDSTGKVVLNGYSILKFAPNNYYAVVSSTENGIGKLYLDNYRFEAYENGISGIDFFNGFNGVRYKDIY
ncbi:MAG: WG repeat-containing protein, partial [Bacteroidota bacterium]